MAFDPFSLRVRIEHWLDGRPDDSVLSWLFRAMLAITVAVVAVDYVQLRDRSSEPLPDSPAVEQDIGPDISKTLAEPASLRTGGVERRAVPLRRPDPQLAAAMTFELTGDGRLMAVGTIQSGTAKIFAAEIEKRGGYVKTVVLHSPGGSVTDALAMGRLIRQQTFATEVEDGRYCASSCPLVFAGGIERRAGAKATIGVHQVSAVARNGEAPGNGMESVQRVSAECQRYLHDMGIDYLVWVHAMETPPAELFVFKQAELSQLKLVTSATPSIPSAAIGTRRKS